jgi:dTDP-4-dehydrorhamnose 3,5-epimerase
MQYEELPIRGAWLITPAPTHDERGLFARLWDAAEFEARGLGPPPVQLNTGWSPRRGTLRGLHWQAAGAPEAKLVRVVRGAAFDVIVDLRPGSPTFRRWQGVELTAENRHAVWVPPLCAHGYLTLADDTELQYAATAPYTPSEARGARWDDPALAIAWPAEVRVISERDRTWPLLDAAVTA